MPGAWEHNLLTTGNRLVSFLGRAVHVRGAALFPKHESHTMTTIAKPDVIDQAFAVDLEALAAAEAIAAAIAAGETPNNIREVCRAVDWDEAHLAVEVDRQRKVIACKEQVAANEQAHRQFPKLEAEKKAELLREGERVKAHLARVLSIVKKEHELGRLHSEATTAWSLLRHELLPRRHRDEIAALTVQLLPLNRGRARLESQIHELEFEIPVDQEIVAQTTAPGGKQKYRDGIAARNTRRAALRRDLQPALETAKQEMKTLLDREEELRSTYVQADPWSAAEREQ